MLAELQRPVEAQPRLLTLYMEDVDDEGHAYGPDSIEVDAAILAVGRPSSLSSSSSSSSPPLPPPLPPPPAHNSCAID